MGADAVGATLSRTSHKIKIARSNKPKATLYINSRTMPDVGETTHSPSAELMKLVDIDHLSDFEEVVAFISANVDKVIAEVHGFDKLFLDNEKVMLNCPPAPESGDSHGSELIRTLSEKEGPGGVALKREFKVHDMGVDAENAGQHKIEIREDVVKAGNNGPEYSENIKVVSITRA
eukprot:Nitzschia sp. Nitz4//scaffold188_size43225//8310//8927//NITZ4_007343-RA/size43225-snap-gene-0.38-mRNA-1//-1//CDS//3329539838//9222//frame0